MEHYQNFLNALIAATPELVREALPNTAPESLDDLVNGWLFPALGYDAENDFARSPYGQFMTYVEWKEPYIDLNELKAVQKLGVSFDMEQILEPAYEQANESFEQADFLDDDPMAFLDWSNDNPSSAFLPYYNQALEPHGLCLIDIGAYENSYLLLVHNYEDKINQLRQSMEDLGLTTLF